MVYFWEYMEYNYRIQERSGEHMYSVYLVDDDILITEEMINIIPWSENGYIVTGSSSDPIKACAEIIKDKPNVVFCDLKMPGLSGIELIKKLKDEGCDAFFVMLSAYDAYEDVRAFYMSSGYDYILKPVNMDEVLDVLKGLSGKLAEKAGSLSLDEGTLDSDSFEKMVAYVDANYSEKITLDELSKRFGFSRNYICDLFSKRYNTSLTQYIADVRMRHAAELLRDSNKTIKDIAISCGYTNMTYFYRVFKSCHGMSAGEFRNGTDK